MTEGKYLIIRAFLYSSNNILCSNEEDQDLGEEVIYCEERSQGTLIVHLLMSW